MSKKLQIEAKPGKASRTPTVVIAAVALLVGLGLWQLQDREGHPGSSGPTARAAGSSFSGTHVGVEKFRELIERGDGVLIDVRTSGEIARGHLKGAIPMNIYEPDFDRKISELDRHKPVLVYCASGNRSRTAARRLVTAGFEQVYGLEGGILAWRQAGLPLVMN